MWWLCKWFTYKHMVQKNEKNIKYGLLYTNVLKIRSIFGVIKVEHLQS